MGVTAAGPSRQGGTFTWPLALDDIDDREDCGEERSNMIGVTGDRLLVVT